MGTCNAGLVMAGATAGTAVGATGGAMACTAGFAAAERVLQYATIETEGTVVEGAMEATVEDKMPAFIVVGAIGGAALGGALGSEL